MTTVLGIRPPAGRRYIRAGRAGVNPSPRGRVDPRGPGRYGPARTARPTAGSPNDRHHARPGGRPARLGRPRLPRPAAVHRLRELRRPVHGELGRAGEAGPPAPVLL